MGILAFIVLLIIFVCREQSRAEEEIFHKRTIKEFVNEVQLLKSCLDEEGMRIYNEKKKQRIVQGTIESSRETLSTTTNLNSQPIQKQVVNEVRKERKTIQKETLKNSAILAVGSIFIVIAAISFLYTGWDVLSNALKIGVLVILAGMFLALSHFAKHKMKLPQTSKAFFYIAMGYIPIVLFSLSLLDLIGEYFSISGDGRFIYFCGSSVVIMLLYYVISVKLNDSKLHIAAHVMQSLVLFFALLAFDVSDNYYGIYFIFHAIVFNIFSDKINLFKKSNKSYSLIQSIFYTIASVPSFFSSIETEVYMVFHSAFVMVLYYLLNKKYHKAMLKYIGHVFQCLVIFFICLAIDMEIYLYPVVFLLHSTIFNMVSNKMYETKDSINSFGKWLFRGYGVISFVFTMIYIGNWISVLLPLLLILNVKVIKANGEKNVIYKSTVLNILVYFFIAVASFLEIELGNVVYSLPWIAREILWIFIILSTTVLYFKKPNIKFAKNGILINYLCLLLMSFVTSNTESVLIPANIFTLLGYLLILGSEKFANVNNRKFIRNAALIYTLFRFLMESSLMSHIICLLVCAITLVIYERNSELQKYRLIPLIAYFIKLCDDGYILFGESTVIPIIISLSIFVLLEILSFVKIKKNEPYVIMSFFFMLLSFDFWPEEISVYVFWGAMVIWALTNLIVTIDNLRIAVKSVLSFALFLIYNNLVNDFMVGNEVVFTHLGIITYMHFITRYLFNKKLSGYKVIEYVGLIFTYLAAMGSVVEPVEALLYLVMLTILVIIAYLKRIGPLFAVTIVAMLVQLFDLTQNFWLAIPWWLYLVAIGAVLIVFSMRNEKSNQNNKKLLKEKLQSVKQYLDM